MREKEEGSRFYKQIVIISLALRFFWICFDFKEIFLTHRFQHQIEINAEKIESTRRIERSREEEKTL